MKDTTINRGTTDIQNAVTVREFRASAMNSAKHLGNSKIKGFKTVKNNAAGDELNICSECEMHLADCMCDWLFR